MPDLEPIGDFLVCQNNDRNPISLRRVSDEIVCLGFNPKLKQLVELHVIGDTEQMKGNGKSSFLERAWNAGTLESRCFQNVLAAADDNGIFFYATEVNEGEFLTDYIVRTGPVATQTALAMTLDLVDALVEIEPHYRLLLALKLKNLMVVLDNSAYLTLRIIDLGLGRPEPRGMNDFEIVDILADVSCQLYYLLAGRPYTTGQPGQIESLTQIDTSIRELLSATIEPAMSSVSSFDRYLELLTSAYIIGAQNKPRRSAITATPKTRPRLTLQREIFDRCDATNQLDAASFQFDTTVGDFEYPYALTATRSGNGERGRLSWIPWRGVFLNPPKDAGLILLTGFYYRFLTTTTGVSLLEFLVSRNHRPSMVDSILLLNALAGKLDSGAVKTEAFSVHQVWIELAGKSDEEIQTLMKTGVDQWPSVNIKVLPASETAVLLSPPATASDPTNQQLPLSFLITAQELLCEAPKTVHDLLDAEANAIRTGDQPVDCGSLLIKIADELDK